MNKDQISGEWKSIKGKIKEKWGKLTDDEITQINGKREQLVGKLQSKYGYAKEKAEQEIKDFESSFATAGKHAEREFNKGADHTANRSNDRNASLDRPANPRNDRPNPREPQGKNDKHR